MIEKTIRTISEKTTSVEYDIELSQKGIITHSVLANGYIAIPTKIKTPKILHLMAMNRAGQKALLGAGFYSDLVLYRPTATNATGALNINASNQGYTADTVVHYDGKLYQLPDTLATSTHLLNTNLTTYGKRLDSFASDEACILLAKIVNASAASTVNAKFAFEVRGY